MNRKIIPIRNYFVVFGLFVLLILLTYYLIAWYETKQNYQTNDFFDKFLSVITVRELDNYLTDNPDIIIYLTNSYDKTNDIFETEFKQYITENNLKKEFIYIDNRKNKDYSDIEEYLSEDLKNKNIGINDRTNLLIIRDGKITDILHKNNKKINMVDVKIFLKNNGVIAND